MVAALTIGSTGTRPANELTGIGGRKHARFEAGTVRRGPPAQRADPGPEPCRPVHHRLALVGHSAAARRGGHAGHLRAQPTDRYLRRSCWVEGFPRPRWAHLLTVCSRDHPTPTETARDNYRWGKGEGPSREACTEPDGHLGTRLQ